MLRWLSDEGKKALGTRIGLRCGINTYAYVRGNPVNFVDPEGLAASCTFPTVVCDGKGGLEVCLGPAKGKCDESCTRTHEEQHIVDLMKDRPNKCKNKPYGTIPTFGSGDHQFVRRTECNAYSAGLKCRETLLNGNTCFGPNCETEIRGGIVRDKQKITEFCI